jgi:hypothetical protein
MYRKDFVAMTLGTQIVWLLVLALPVACAAWTVTHEEVFREPREYCERRAERDRSVWSRKFFYLFTLRVLLLALRVGGVPGLNPASIFFMNDWRGYAVAWLALVWIANIYMGIFGKVKLEREEGAGGDPEDREGRERKESRVSDEARRKAGLRASLLLWGKGVGSPLLTTMSPPPTGPLAA